MSLVQQEEAYNKSINLINKFLHFQIQPHDYLNEQQYSTVLEAVLGHQFDYTILPQIIEQCELNDKKEAKIQDFVQVLLTAEQKLLQKIFVSQNALKEYLIQKQEVEYQLNNLQQVPKNQFDLDINSTITIEVIEAYNLYQTQQNVNEIPYIQVKCGNKQFRTTGNVNIVNNQGILYQWNEKFDFPIQMGTEDIYIEVLSFSTTNNQNYLIGKCFLPISDFQDQNKIDQDYAIYDIQNKILPTRLRLGIQYIYDEALYHQQMYDQVTNYIQQMEDDIYDYEQDLNIIREPIYTQFNFNQAPQLSVKNMIQVSKMQNEDQQYATVPNFVWLTYYVALFFVGLSIIESFGRFAMCDLLVAVLVIKNFWMNYFDKIQIKINVIALINAIVYDILYLYIFNQGVMSDLHRMDLIKVESSTPGLYNFAIIITWISLIVKLIIMFLLKDLNFEISNINQKGLYAFGIERFQSEGVHQNPFILLDYQVQNKILRQL